MYIYIIVAVVVLALVLLAVIGVLVYRKKKAKCSHKCPPSDNGSELSEVEKLKPESNSS